MAIACHSMFLLPCSFSIHIACPFSQGSLGSPLAISVMFYLYCASMLAYGKVLYHTPNLVRQFLKHMPSSTVRMVKSSLYRHESKQALEVCLRKLAMFIDLSSWQSSILNGYASILY